MDRLRTLPLYRPRRFVPGHIDLSRWPPIVDLFDRLESRLGRCADVAALHDFLIDWVRSNVLSSSVNLSVGRGLTALRLRTDRARPRPRSIRRCRTATSP